MGIGHEKGQEMDDFVVDLSKIKTQRQRMEEEGKKKRRKQIRNRAKTDEKRVGKFFNARRTPLSGGNSGHTRSDTLHDSLFIEIKGSENMRLFKRYIEERDRLKKEGKCPILVLTEELLGEALFCVWSYDLMRTDLQAVSIQRKPMWVWSLYRDTEEKAIVEAKAQERDRIPVIGICMKNQRGFLLAFRPEHRDRIIQEKKLADEMVRAENAAQQTEAGEDSQSSSD